MQLLLRGERTITRRSCGLALSIPLHLGMAVLLVSLASQQGEQHNAEDEVEITYLLAPGGPTVTDGPASDYELPAQLYGEVDPVDESLRLPLSGFEFNLAKLRANIGSLFPFLTVGLEFLDSVGENDSRAGTGLANPFSIRSANEMRPPLVLSAAALQRIIDRSWSRRDRWRNFSEITAAVQEYHPDGGGVPELIHEYLNQNILQPFCDYRVVTGPPRRETIYRDPRLWAMLENAADHAQFIDFVRSFTRRHPSSKTTTELLFLIDKLAQANFDALVTLLNTDPRTDLSHTALADPQALAFIIEAQGHYARWLGERNLLAPGALKARYDELRLRIMTTIIESTPDGYRASDARFLAGKILFEKGDSEAAVQMWQATVPVSSDSYVNTYTPLRLQASQQAGTFDPKVIKSLLGSVDSEWRVFSYGRLRRFGYACDQF